jgi:EAL domain-containing protein (putative c-di-GMP-specific phosphodiesterase class I)
MPPRYEVLARLRDGSGNLLMPNAFIPPAERYGVMGAIDRWVIRTAFRNYSQELVASNAEMSINLSGISLNDTTLLEFIQAQFSEFALPPERVCFEITETAAIYNLSQAIELMVAIKQHGSRLALDDFGSGLCSFTYLKNLPVDYLKIDGSFVKGMVHDPVDWAIIDTIHRIGHLMGKKTVAECVENEATLDGLRAIGVDYAQGHVIGEPRPLGDG